MSEIPRLTGLDSTRAFRADPYGFIATHCRRFGTDVFEARIALQRTLCMSGPEAARQFYDAERFMRHGAAPEVVRGTLFGKGGVQGLDDAAHLRRKQLFMTLMSRERIARLVALTLEQWEAAARQWALSSHVQLYDELHSILTRAVCAWAGVALPESEVTLRAHDLTALYDLAGAVPVGHLRARQARWRSEDWLARQVRAFRRSQRDAPLDTPLALFANHINERGVRLLPRVAAVELLNVLRPVVAISVYITFLAHALERYPDWRDRVAHEADAVEWFVQEVRRFYPLFPAVFARVRRSFEWLGYTFEPGRRALLDLYGTNHDPRTWEHPKEFRPERFAQWRPNAYNFIAQGGGDFFTQHRCAGEWLTIEMMKGALWFLTERLSYELPQQDLGIDRQRLPALPRDHFVIRSVSLVDPDVARPTLQPAEWARRTNGVSWVSAGLTAH